MPFLGQDWRSPGLQWSKVGTSKWETTDSNFGVTVETIPRNHVKKIIEAFLRQMQTTKNRNSYTNLTSAPISKCSVRENMPWLQIGLQGTRECHGYTTLGEMIRRLDFTGGVSLSYRFPYILQVTYLLVKYEMSTLSATAQQHLFRMVEILLSQVMTTHHCIRQMGHILETLMTVLQSQSKKKLISSKTSWFKKLEIVRKWHSQLKQIEVPYRMDSQATLSDMPVEVQSTIVSCLTDYEDLKSLSCVNRTLHEICENAVVWKDLCYVNFTQAQIAKVQEDVEADIEAHKNDFNANLMGPDNVLYWKKVHERLRRKCNAKEESYVDPLLFCRHCSILFWKETGHPCINELKDYAPDIIELSPQQLVTFFEMR